MRGTVATLLAASGQERARANAREAATELSRRRVEREAVDLLLAGLEPASAPVAPVARSAEGGQARGIVHG